MPRFAFLSRFARWVLQRELAHLHAALRRADDHASQAEMLLEDYRTRLASEKKCVQILKDANLSLIDQLEEARK